jgi:hypothetical protein
MTQRLLSCLAAILALLASAAQPISGGPQEVFGSMSGFWKGPGRIEFEQGASEALLCKAYYTTKDQADRLSIALRCASSSHKIELRAQLAAQGPNLTGTWEERSFNASGTVTGQATDQQISLSIDGGGFSATMLVIQDKGHQSVSITTQGVGFKKVSVALTRGTDGQQDKHD